MFRGNAPAKVDDKGRLKLPSRFAAVIPEDYGRRFFVTSLKGDCAWIYPLEAWRAVERKLAAAPSTNQAIVKFRSNVNFYGLEAELDAADRILIPAHLREKAGVAGEVFVVGADDHLVVWNRDQVPLYTLEESDLKELEAYI